jgi:sulfite reductase alpha subunit-like flavoprotein
VIGWQEELSTEELAVFIMACYGTMQCIETYIFILSAFLDGPGKGEPTDNAKDFYSWLMANDREPGLLNHVNYAVNTSMMINLMANLDVRQYVGVWTGEQQDVSRTVPGGWHSS